MDQKNHNKNGFNTIPACNIIVFKFAFLAGNMCEKMYAKTHKENVTKT